MSEPTLIYELGKLVLGVICQVEFLIFQRYAVGQASQTGASARGSVSKVTVVRVVLYPSPYPC